MASICYNAWKKDILDAGINMGTADIRCALLITTTSTPDNPDHDFLNDVTADEASDGSYARVACTGEATSVDNANDRAEWTCSNITFSTLSGGTIVFAIIFEYNAVDSAAGLISAHDITDTAPNGTDFVLEVGANGVIHIT